MMRYMVEGIDTDTLCANCGQRWGRHASLDDWCPPFRQNGKWVHPDTVKPMRISHDSHPMPVVEFRPNQTNPIKGS